MHKALHNLPVFDGEAFRAQTDAWKPSLKSAGPGGNRVVVEWSVGRGPNVFAYPATKRAEGVQLVAPDTRGQSDERWADFLEFDYLPKVLAALQENGLTPQVICVDLRPLQIQRARRRAIANVAHEKTGTASAH